ncbi:putative HTH domain antitoxin [Salinibacter ruber]|uniref:UPF0175 family protein n=1 Tax=Salinibacter ruber TaxID=146919 RepID=UPI0021692B71|nr:UPF0175 family protein [Salinibacter ruber]MCS4194402.1 putative HTH domain antitoxin [Salinibacter ruber]
MIEAGPSKQKVFSVRKNPLDSSRGEVKSSTVTFEIPREVLHATRMSEDELRRELALHLFDEGKLSFGKARELAGMSVWDFQQLLGHRGIAVHYDVDAYEQDRQTLKRLGRI